MFNRARLHLTLAYAVLLGVTAVLIAGAIGVLSVQEARSTDDRELQIRASAIAAAIPSGPPPEAAGPRFIDQYGGSGPPAGGPGDAHNPGGPDYCGPRLEEQGLLEYTMPVRGGQISPPASTVAGLPDLNCAQLALQNGRGHYTTTSVNGSQVRVYSLPVLRAGQTVAVVQVARSQYFVNSAVTRLVLIALLSGVAGVLISGGAGYWLAGRTLKPISVALDRQRDFAADASHELRTPLTVMLTNAELLSLHPERPLAEYQDVVGDIVAEIQRLSRLVTDLLTLARADQGRLPLELDAIDLSAIAETIARQFAAVAADKGVVLNWETDRQVVVWGDQDRLHQLALILVDNAVRYTDSGTITVRTCERDHDGVLEVSDTGHGIAPEHLPHLFERFYRTDQSRSTDEGGTGLGLALAQWIVQAHHGHIEVTSSPGTGSTFTVRLPSLRARRSSSGLSKRR